MNTATTGTELISRARALRKEVGHTPLVQLTHLELPATIELWVKKEWEQLSGSVKCRAAYFIILDAIEKGKLNEEITLLDATSGNTGIAYASIGAQLGIPVTLCLPENASIERKEILRSLGAEIIPTSKFEGTDGAQEEAAYLASRYPEKYFYADQYKNENNWKAHYYTTAPEIIEQLPGITHFVSALGTTGTFTGTARGLKEYNKEIEVTSLQPDNPLHGLEGWKHLETAIVPTIYDDTLADRKLEVGTEEAYAMLKTLATRENLLVSPSAAASVAGAVKLAGMIGSGKIVTVLADNADKYSEVIQKIIR